MVVVSGQLRSLWTIAVVLLALRADVVLACSCAPAPEEFWPSGVVDVARAVRPLVVNPNAQQGYRLVDGGEIPSHGADVDLGRPNDPGGRTQEVIDLGPVPPEATEVQISARALGESPDRRNLALELVPKHPLPAHHRFLVVKSDHVQAVFVTGDLLEPAKAVVPTPRLVRIEYPRPIEVDSHGRSFNFGGCDTGSASLLYWIGYGPGGSPRVFGIWAPGASEEAPLGFSRTVNGELDLGHPGSCGFYGIVLKPGKRVDLILREAISGVGFGPPIRVMLDLPHP